MNNTFFQYYKNDIHSSNPLGFVSLRHFINAHINPKPETVKLLNEIKYCTEKGDAQGKAKLKEQLYSFTPCVIIKPGTSRRYANIKSFTGLMVLDFDKINNAIAFKEFLFSEYQEIIAAWVSPSGKGVKAFVKIPIVTSTDEFKSYYFGIASEMFQYNGFDESGQNSVLPLFISFDYNLLYRNDAETWNTKGIKVNDFTTPITTPVHRLPDNYIPNSNDEGAIIGIIKSGMDKIKDNGHPQLRSLCLAVGGYVASGYISEYTALGEINKLIEQHDYLKKGIRGYQRTAQWAVRVGQSKPLTLQNNE